MTTTKLVVVAGPRRSVIILLERRLLSFRCCLGAFAARPSHRGKHNHHAHANVCRKHAVHSTQFIVLSHTHAGHRVITVSHSATFKRVRTKGLVEARSSRVPRPPQVPWHGPQRCKRERRRQSHTEAKHLEKHAKAVPTAITSAPHGDVCISTVRDFTANEGNAGAIAADSKRRQRHCTVLATCHRKQHILVIRNRLYLRPIPAWQCDLHKLPRTS